MKAYVARAAGATRAVVRAVRSEQVTFLAASIAYYGFVSLLPLLLFGLAAASVVGEGQLAADIAADVAATFGDRAGAAVLGALTSAEGRSGATVAGLVVLVWSGLKVFRGLDIAFSQVYGTEYAESFVEQLVDAAVCLAAVVVAVVLVVALSALASFSGIAFAGLLATPALVVSLTVALLPLYVLFPDRDVPVREALPGAAFAAVGWTTLATLFRVYAGYAGAYEAYGIVGGMLLLVTWLYFGGIVLLVGAVLNAVLGGRLDETDIPRDLVEPTHGQQSTLMGENSDFDIGDDADVEQLREELRRFEERVDERTVHRDQIEGELKQYVRERMRGGHARGWGPYLVLLYGTAMTLGAFYLLSGGWAILAMVVVWLSTLGLYALMLLVGTAVGAASLPGRLAEKLRALRG
ncbi:MAG: YihY/virulence factor BrkB family protein [Haloarculaceae archaeon]